MRNRPGRISFVVLLALTASGAAFSAEDKLSQDKLIRFEGEVSRDHEFRRPIGQGLVFALIPERSYPGVISGWTITVSPAAPAGNAACQEYAWVVMPPYRSYNPRYLSNSYGTTAAVAVQISPRNFSFVLNCGDYQVEASRVNIVLWPGDHTDKDYNDALAKLGSSPQGHGKLWIDDAKTGRAAKGVDGVNYGSIDWIRFHVEIQFP